MYHEMKNAYLVMNTENLTRIVTMKDLENLNANCDQNTYLLRLCTITSEDIKYPKASDNEMDPTNLRICTGTSWKTPRDYDDAFHVMPIAKFWKQILQRIRHHISNLDTQSTIVLFRWWSVSHRFLSMLNHFWLHNAYYEHASTLQKRQTLDDLHFRI